MILVRNLAYAYGKQPIFEGADFFVDKNQKVGLIGQNGSGKSTLFKLLTGEEHPDDGKMEITGNVLLVPQEVKYDEEMEAAKSIRDYIDPKKDKEDYELLRIMAKLELGRFQLSESPQILSGGQKTKLAITRALVQQPEILLLDEPTNFLDIEGKEWVMQFLSHYPKTLIVISHDLNLMEKDIDKILEVNPQSHKIIEYNGNYVDYVRIKGEQEAILSKSIRVQKRQIIEMKKGFAKVARLKSEKGVRQKLQFKKRIDKMIESLPTMPSEAKKIRVQLPTPAWMGELPILAEHICKSYGSKKVLDDVSIEIHRGERIAMLGRNGAGKSTLIKILMGLTQADSGEIIYDDRVSIGYYSQEFETFDFEKTLVETIQESSSMELTKIRSMLGRFLFSGDKVFQKVGTLSGGEKTRLSIARLLVQDFNLLILDEPTTYLDVLSQRLILEALKQYKGSMLLVSHTPEFVAELKPARKFYLPEKKWVIM
ncbi:MAG TPA: ABC-F family ATP-binding cassette domain-containing protein [Patescibacteria group bacterium]